MSAPEKPPHGSPCNGCGLCCRVTLCPLGAALFGREQGLCPALEPQGERFGCGLVSNPQTYRPTRARMRGRAALSQAALTLIGSGVGCDAIVEGEKPDSEWYAKMRRHADSIYREVRRAKILWGFGER